MRRDERHQWETGHPREVGVYKVAALLSDWSRAGGQYSGDRGLRLQQLLSAPAPWSPPLHLCLQRLLMGTAGGFVLASQTYLAEVPGM